MTTPDEIDPTDPRVTYHMLMTLPDGREYEEDIVLVDDEPLLPFCRKLQAGVGEGNARVILIDTRTSTVVMDTNGMGAEGA